MEVRKDMRTRLGDLLVEHKLITEEELELALESQRMSNKKRLGEILIEGDHVTREELLKMLAFQLEVRYLDLDETEVDFTAAKLFPEKLALKYGCVPIRCEDGELVVAMSDPLNLQALDDLKQITRLEIVPAVADREQIEITIRRCHTSESVSSISDSIPDMEDGLFRVIKSAKDENGKEDSITDLRIQSQQAPIIKIVNIVINEAIEELATDIHVEPQSDSLVVRNRVDGVLYEKHHMPRWIHGPVVSRIKIMADMDIAEKRVPQDGKVRISLGSRHFDLRISTLPSIFGEKVAIRLLERRGGQVQMDELGFNPAHLEQMRGLNTRNQGLILVTGPTGSGKSTTLNAMLREIRTPKINIVTVEDPVEYEIPKITQVHVNPKAGLTFPFVLRSILRQDPDVIMVGEIRDPETAQIAMRAAMTGHLVLSTLHTNDAPSAVTRLANLEMPPFLIGSTLLYVLAQRLIRKLCPYCTINYEPSRQELEKIKAIIPGAASLAWKKGRGCPKCHDRGYAGRMAVGELFLVNNETRYAIENREPESVIQRLAVTGGMRTLLADFIDKVTMGATAMEEIWKVITGDEGGSKFCPSCSGPIEPAYLRCPGCGFKLKEKCTECGSPVENGWRFCPHCHEMHEHSR
jgi:type IV pilus assembly protein PilB